jgi:hypothetical protein
MPFDTTLDYPLCSIWRYYIRLSAVLHSAWRYYKRLSNLPNIRSDLYGDLQTTICYDLLSRDTVADYAMCSTLSVDSTSDYPIYRLSALICIGILQTIICCALLCSTLLYSILSRDTTTDYLRCSTLYGDVTSDYPIYRLSALICLTIYLNRPSAVVYSVWQYYLQPAICGVILCLAMLQAFI